MCLVCRVVVCGRVCVCVCVACVVRVAHVCVCVCGCVRQKLPSSIKDMVNNSPFLAADGTLFVGSKDSQIFTLELDTGSLASVHSTKGLSTQLVPTDPDDDEKNANQVTSRLAFLTATNHHRSSHHQHVGAIIVTINTSCSSCGRTTRCGRSITRAARSDGMSP